MLEHTHITKHIIIKNVNHNNSPRSTREIFGLTVGGGFPNALIEKEWFELGGQGRGITILIWGVGLRRILF